MKKITDFIIQKRNVIIILFIIFTILSVFLSNKVRINYDMAEYLPSDSETRIGMDIMNEEFEQEKESNLNIMFKNLTEEDKDKIYDTLSKIEGVSSIDYDKNSEEYNVDEYTLYSVKVEDTEDSKTAAYVYNNVNEEFKNYEFYTSGSISDRNMVILPVWIIILAVAICAIILIIMCESYVEPFLFLICIGIAVLLNKGTNIIFGTVSNITSSISAILQLALSMDYSIMLINRYKQEKEKNADKVEAMKEALYKSFGSISSSSITTIVGLIALVFMSFTIGRDLGLVLAKGVLLSLLVIFTCLPALILMFDKLIVKTKKKAPNITLNKLGNIAYKFRSVGFIMLIILFVGSYILKGNLKMLYTDSEVNHVADIFQETNQMAIIYKNEDEEKVSKYLNEIENNEKVEDVLAYGNTINEKLKYNEFNNKLKDLDVDTQIEDYLLKILYYKYYNENIDNKMTFNEFVDFTKNNVLNNENFASKLDENTDSNIKRLEKFTSNDEMNVKRTYSEIANILQMNETDCYNLLVYLYSDKINISMTINEFVNFINKDVLTDNEYSSSIPASAKESLNTISKFMNKNTLNKSMTSSEMANLFGLSDSQVKDLYLYYYSINGTNNKLTLNEFANYVANEILPNSKYSSIFDNSTAESIKLLQTMSNTSIINKKMTAKELASVFGINEEMINMIMLLKNAQSDNGTTLSISELINFIIYLNENTDYLDGIDTTSIYSLKAFANNEGNFNSIKMNKQQLSQVFNNLNNGLVNTVYTVLNLPDTYQMTTQEFVNLIIEKFANNLDETTLNNLKLIKIVIDDSVSSTPKKYTATEISSIININKSNLYQIYGLYDYTNGNNSTWSLSPYDFVKFIIDNSSNEKISSNINTEQLSKLKYLYTIMNNSNNNMSYSYNEIAKIIGADENTTKKIYALNASSQTTLKLTPTSFVDFILKYKNDDVLSKNLNSSTIEKLNLLNKIIDSVLTNKKYSVDEISNLLEVNKDDVKLLYSLYSAKYINSNMNASLKEFVEFVLNNVVTNEKYSDKFNDDKILKLNTINGIMNSVSNGTQYSPEEIFAIISKLTDSIDKDTIEMLYIYYGSEKNYQDNWVITIEEFINYINDDILNDNRFNDFIDDDIRNKVVDAKVAIQDNKKRLVGNNYSRVIINTKFDLEGEETYKFLQKMYDDFADSNVYIIGDSPMAYEMSKSFESEFNFISILTIIAIFVVVAITFKSITIPFILVLIIQCAVYMTMGILSLLGGSVYFISLLIVQSILMGATIDYAILYTSYYKESRNTLDVKQSVINAYNKSINTILTSSSILVIATFIVGKYASAIAAKICQTLSQGVLCSTILILLILPEVLALCDKFIVKQKRS